jgi:hypothetical protein
MSQINIGYKSMAKEFGQAALHILSTLSTFESAKEEPSFPVTLQDCIEELRADCKRREEVALAIEDGIKHVDYLGIISKDPETMRLTCDETASAITDRAGATLDMRLELERDLLLRIENTVNVPKKLLEHASNFCFAMAVELAEFAI